jgi:DnaJ family protein B protein 4
MFAQQGGGMGGMPGGMHFSSMGGGGFPGGFPGGMGMPPGMNGAGRGGAPSPGGVPRQQAPAVKPPAIEVPLTCTLEELCTGATKQRKLTRRVWNEAAGGVQQREEVLSIDVKPGWKAGTKIRFEDKGDVLAPDAAAADLLFTVAEAPHPVFSRRGSDLVTHVPVTLAEALQPGGCTVAVPTIDGRTRRVHAVGQQLSGGAPMVLPGEGMPVAKAPGTRGNLVVHLDVRLPTAGLSDAQRVAMAEALRGASYDTARRPPSEYS